MKIAIIVILSVVAFLISMGVFSSYIEQIYRKRKKKKLFRLLKEFGLYNSFMENMKANKTNPVSFFMDTRPVNYVYRAFGWNTTLQGRDFWYVIHYMWLKHTEDGESIKKICSSDFERRIKSLKKLDRSKTYGITN